MRGAGGGGLRAGIGLGGGGLRAGIEGGFGLSSIGSHGRGLEHGLR